MFQARVCGRDGRRQTAGSPTATTNKLGDLVLERADTVVLLDLPVALVMLASRAAHVRPFVKRDEDALEREPRGALANQIRWLIWSCVRVRSSTGAACRRGCARASAAAAQRRALRSTRDVEASLQSIQATESMSGSSNGSDRQKTPPLAET